MTVPCSQHFRAHLAPRDRDDQPLAQKQRRSAARAEVKSYINQNPEKKSHKKKNLKTSLHIPPSRHFSLASRTLIHSMECIDMCSKQRHVRPRFRIHLEDLPGIHKRLLRQVRLR